MLKRMSVLFCGAAVVLMTAERRRPSPLRKK